MIAIKLHDLFTRYKLKSYVGPDDFSDRLQFLYTPLLLTIFAAVVGTNTYVFTPLTCYTPIKVAGMHLNDFMKNYCWTKGTIFLRKGEFIPQEKEKWNILENSRRQKYYVWVPLALSLEAFLHYLPRFLRMEIFLDKTLLNTLQDTLQKLSKSETINPTSHFMTELLNWQHAKTSGHFRRIALKYLPYRILNLSICLRYTLIKLFCLVINFENLGLLNYFLQPYDLNDKGYTSFLSQLGKQLFNESAYKENNLFPRVCICRVTIRILGAQNSTFYSQCVLTVNMLNEKIFIFLWFWCVFLIITTTISILVWIVRIGLSNQHRSFLKKYLSRDKELKNLKETFLKQILSYDGIFFLQMIRINNGDVVVGRLIKKMFYNYVKHWNKDFANRNKKLFSLNNKDDSDIQDEQLDEENEIDEQIPRVMDDNSIENCMHYNPQDIIQTSASSEYLLDRSSEV